MGLAQRYANRFLVPMRAPLVHNDLAGDVLGPKLPLTLQEQRI